MMTRKWQGEKNETETCEKDGGVSETDNGG